VGPPPARLTPSSLRRTRTIIGASAIGSAHVRKQLPCQDAFLALEYDGSFAIAVADGLGSATHADVGASAAVFAAATRALRSADDDAAVSAIEACIAAREALELVAAIDGLSLRDLACTLLVAAGNEEHTGVAHIGDGAIVALCGEELHVLSPPEDSEYLNEVHPLTAADWERHVRWASCRTRADALAVFTDGCQHAALRRKNGVAEAHAGFFVPLFDFARSGIGPDDGRAALEQLLTGRKMSEYSDDDKTLVIAVL
jgi:hypothetical protein